MRYSDTEKLIVESADFQKEFDEFDQQTLIFTHNDHHKDLNRYIKISDFEYLKNFFILFDIFAKFRQRLVRHIQILKIILIDQRTIT